ncbi:hypothetical protein PENDEC_c010G06550 [Penicillium decumbens]|uniref:Fungal-type protein kinase domain-containing protein n=1 Tax=Penicillium decumbens TaxID=69771 RepID=A0A1V6PC58_PENDC|nr:hypothetical protein PENDEC_c010G06550 [Penicillium decumbens]
MAPRRSIQSSQKTKIFKKVPSDWPKWKRAADATIKRRSPHKQPEFHSGSELTQEEYLLLRVIWPPARRSFDQATLMSLGLTQFYTQADTWLRLFTPFTNYLQAVRSNAATATCDTANATHDQVGLAVFEPARFEQNQIISVINTTGIDEDSVNSSLLSLLCAITIKHPAVHCEWMTHRLAFKATFNSGAELEARVDGYLRNDNDGTAKVILEVKRGDRNMHEPQVSMQEAAEVVALLKTYEPTCTKPVYVISQDANSMWITAASFTQNYLDFMAHRRKSVLGQADFLRMNRFGPWRINNPDHMREFATLALAIALHAS